MAKRKKNFFRKATPGQLYSGITDFGEQFEEDDEERIIEKQDPFVDFCKNTAKKFPSFKRGASFDEAHAKAVAFLGWKLTPGEFFAAMKGTAVMGIIPIIIVIAFVYAFGIGIDLGTINTLDYIPGGGIFGVLDSNMHFQFFMMISFILLGALGMGIYMIYSYPLQAANVEKNKALTAVPEMIGYLIMSMKLVPNLEKSIEFASHHGKGKLAKDFKRLMWDFQIGLYDSVSSGLDELAYRWGDYSSELKEALMRIRASVMEPSESHRYQVLDKTMVDVLESVKEKMEDYARSLSQPSIMLFYLGVLLPLILIIILPIGSAFSQSPLANPFILAGIYCFGIPLVAYLFAKNVIEQRPPTYEPPQINDDFEELPKKWSMQFSKGKEIDIRFIAVIILLVGLGLSFFVSSQGLPPKMVLTSFEENQLSSVQIIPPDRDLYSILRLEGQDEFYLGKKIVDLYFIDEYDVRQGTYYTGLVSEGMTEDIAYKRALQKYFEFTSNPQKDPTKYLFWAGVIMTIVLVASFILYYKNIYKRKAQLKIVQMEDEFKEAMYVIASRMGENKPVESALKQAKAFLPSMLISKRIFGKTVENIELMGLPLDGAVFDPIYGSMKGIPSKVLRTAMQLLVDSVSLGVEVASRTLMSLSLQMENMDKVNKGLKNLVSDVTTTMTTMAVFIGPIVLGITVALQRVVMMTLAGVVADPAVSSSELDLGATTGSSMNMNSFFNLTVETFQGMASPLVFLIVVSIYVIEIVIIMIYFTTKVQEDNDLLFKINLAKYLPIATAVFLITAIAANYMVGALMS